MSTGDQLLDEYLEGVTDPTAEAVIRKLSEQRAELVRTLSSDPHTQTVHTQMLQDEVASVLPRPHAERINVTSFPCSISDVTREATFRTFGPRAERERDVATLVASWPSSIELPQPFALYVGRLVLDDLIRRRDQ